MRLSRTAGTMSWSTYWKLGEAPAMMEHPLLPNTWKDDGRKLQGKRGFASSRLYPRFSAIPGLVFQDSTGKKEYKI